MTDFIGDIHGHAAELKELLEKMGYCNDGVTYSHPERTVLFVGDYIDRGPKIIETLEIVKAMVDSNNAIALLGNHEYNALCYHYKGKNGKHLRIHSEKNREQHIKTLDQFQDKQEDYLKYINWFQTLPLFYETDSFRAVHACWDHTNIELLRGTLVNDRLNYNLICESAKEGTPLYEAIEQTLKGKELKMPEGMYFEDKEKSVRTEFRIKWWENPAQMTYKEISVQTIAGLPETAIDVGELKSSDYYSQQDKKVFFGHYWLEGEPSLFKDNICCLDYSVAKDGKLVAYRLNKENRLDPGKLTYV